MEDMSQDNKPGRINQQRNEIEDKKGTDETEDPLNITDVVANGSWFPKHTHPLSRIAITTILCAITWKHWKPIDLFKLCVWLDYHAYDQRSFFVSRTLEQLADEDKETWDVLVPRAMLNFMGFTLMSVRDAKQRGNRSMEQLNTEGTVTLDEGLKAILDELDSKLEFMAKPVDLKDALLKVHRHIHESTVNLQFLTPEQIAMIVKAGEIVVGEEIAITQSKSLTKTAKALPKGAAAAKVCDDLLDGLL